MYVWLGSEKITLKIFTAKGNCITETEAAQSLRHSVKKDMRLNLFSSLVSHQFPFGAKQMPFEAFPSSSSCSSCCSSSSSLLLLPSPSSLLPLPPASPSSSLLPPPHCSRLAPLTYRITFYMRREGMPRLFPPSPLK